MKSRRKSEPKSYKRTDKVDIIGFAESYKQARWDDQSVAKWTLNEFVANRHCKPDQWERHFELHDRDVIEADRTRMDGYCAWLQAQDANRPVYTKEVWPDIPASVRFPRETLRHYFWWSKGRREYFTSSIGWMVALAIYEGYTEIGLYGVDLASDSEYGVQRPNTEYFVGLAEGLGIIVHVAESSALLKANYVYGYEPAPEDFGVINQTFLAERRRLIASERNKAISKINSCDGFIEAFREVQTRHSTGETIDGEYIEQRLAYGLDEHNKAICATNTFDGHLNEVVNLEKVLRYTSRGATVQCPAAQAS